MTSGGEEKGPLCWAAFKAQLWFELWMFSMFSIWTSGSHTGGCISTEDLNVSSCWLSDLQHEVRPAVSSAELFLMRSIQHTDHDCSKGATTEEWGDITLYQWTFVSSPSICTIGKWHNITLNRHYTDAARALFCSATSILCSFLGTTKGNSTCHVPSLLYAGSRSSTSWGLQRNQTSTDSSINWFTDISPERTVFFLLSQSQAENTNSCSPAETPHAGCGCGPGRPEANLEHAAWHATESPARGPAQTWLPTPQFISINVKPLWYYFQNLGQWAARNWPLTSVN